ncbi:MULTISPECIES: DUF6670 family protein [Gordonia]|uniref:DUF6670 family protein n=1 Tax=Gordonia TaxID=2053 RepID=UPI00133145EB|nr:MULTISPECIES: DUF6670 family protein [Gordonia]UPW12263.1 hypothetical protein M0655_12760 [Gordonia amicalis]
MSFAERGARTSTKPHDPDYLLRPHVGERRFGWTHYGVMIPDLPSPHRYLSVMIMAGMPGQSAFDVDEVVATSPRDTVTVSVSTAVAAQYKSLSMSRECHLGADGDDLRFGSLVTISGRYPEFSVVIDIPGLYTELRFAMADRATWFVQGLPYHHLSLLGDFTGVIRTDDSTLTVSGQGNIEYARCVGPYALRDRLLPATRKLPVDFFTYHVVSLPDDAQILFCRVGMLAERVGDLVQHRTTTSAGDWRVNNVSTDRTFYEVLDYEEQPRVDQGGHRMLLPRRFRFGVRDRLTVTGTYDTEPRYGVGRGYIWGYMADVDIDGRTIRTRGYSEYVNVRAT